MLADLFCLCILGLIILKYVFTIKMVVLPMHIVWFHSEAA